MTNLPPYLEEAPEMRPGLWLAPDKFDWRTTGFISNIKNQGQCGSCWAFSATENIESVYARTKNIKPPVLLAPQQMVDCDRTNYGCGGGWPYMTFQYIAKAGGQDTETVYPYTARDGTCKFNPQGVGAKISGYKSIPKDEAQIQNLVADVTNGAPFSICVDAASWQFYKSGVMTSNQCGTSVDHCVQLIGYDTSKTSNPLPFWIVRNSWGTGWGNQGIILLEMFKNTCIMSNYVTTAIPM
jgi:C1A family cysteine protease